MKYCRQIVGCMIFINLAKTEVRMGISNDDIDFLHPVMNQEFETLLSDSEVIIEQARVAAFKAVNVLLVKRNWLLGKRISEEAFGDNGKPEYGSYAVSELSKRLTAQYGEGFDRTNLYRYIEFSRLYPTLFSFGNEAPAIVDTACQQSLPAIVATLCQQSDIYGAIPTQLFYCPGHTIAPFFRWITTMLDFGMKKRPSVRLGVYEPSSETSLRSITSGSCSLRKKERSKLR